MNLLHTDDGQNYRRWFNFIISFLLPGIAQFLAGKPRIVSGVGMQPTVSIGDHILVDKLVLSCFRT